MWAVVRCCHRELKIPIQIEIADGKNLIEKNSTEDV